MRAKRIIQGRGFTLIELLVVIAIIAILASILLPALSHAKQSGLMASCLSNKKQLDVGWQMYTDDFSDHLPVNGDWSGGITNNGVVTPSWCEGILDWTPSTENTNTAYLINPTNASLGPYVASSPQIYWCPADVYLSSQQVAAGFNNRCRSVAMDGAVGPGQKYGSIGWTVWYADKGADLNNPGPANTWLMLDEHPDSIDDEVLYVNPADATNSFGLFTELPSGLHNNAGAVSFCDGHAEIHKWQDPRTDPPVVAQEGLTIIGKYQQIPMPNNVDLQWFAQKTANSP